MTKKQLWKSKSLRHKKIQLSNKSNSQIFVTAADRYPSEMKMESQNVENIRRCTGEKSQKCNQCDFESAWAGTLKRHLKIHSGERSFKCNQCDFAIVHTADLRRHLKIHSGEKSFKCNQCEFASVRAGNLRRHLKAHSGEKSFKCNQCDFALLTHTN